MSNILGLLILVADIWSIVQIVKGRASTGSKVLWCLLILFLPVVGLLIWYFVGRK
jgi:hypothetical protein